MTAGRLIEVSREGDVVILTPLRDLRELEFQEIEAELREVADDPGTVRVVVDFARTDYLGSTALAMLALLGRRTRERGGRLALCNVSAHEREIIEIARLGHLWSVYPGRAEALAAAAG